MLDAEEYLNRVIPAAGNFLCFGYKQADWKFMAHRFWPRSEMRAAVNWMRYLAHKLDVYVAVAAYRNAQPDGTDRVNQPKFKGKRTGDNAELIQCFFYDADILRPGDGKTPDKAWVDDNELTGWLDRLRDEYGMPLPNLWVRSGYGAHLYWVFDEPMERSAWVPHAEAFKALLVKSGAKGDIGVSGDIARVLRTPESFNHKVPEHPAQCYDMTPEGLPEFYPTPDLLSVLGNYRSNGKGEGLNGAAPPRATRRLNLLAAAKAGIERSPHDMARIAANCAQVWKSREEHGVNDGRELWHLMVNLAYACRDREWAHRLGDGHKTYSVEDTDAKYDETDAEHAKKDFGAPFCASFNTARTGICTSCPHWGLIDTPYSLGIETDDTGLPPGYRRHDGWIEVEVERKDQGTFWQRLIVGDVSDPLLLSVPGTGARLQFDYIRAGMTEHVSFDETELSQRADVIARYFAKFGVSLNRSNALAWGDFMKAWIEHLRDQCAMQQATASFGWVPDAEADGYAGLAVGGTFYASDGTTRPALLGDPNIHQSYVPRGTLEGWQDAASFVLDGRPELQTIVAAAFGAPIMEFTGASGCMNVWSRLSGARKSSAFTVGAAVWCNPRTGMSALRDTTNAVQHSLSETKFMPVYWDEIHTVSKEHMSQLIENFFNITQGRGKARLDSRIQAREVGQWRTIFMTSANRPLAELVERDRVMTDAGSVRIFEFEIEPKGKAVAHAGTIVQGIERNYGQAGRIYAAWIAERWETVRKAIVGMIEHIDQHCGGVEPAERFYVATVAAISVGAGIAKKLKLYDFDLAGIYQHLITELLRQRRERTEATPLDEREQLALTFNRFCEDNTGALLVTQAFAKQGARPATISGEKFILHQPLPNVAAAMIHIGIDDAELRFNRKSFEKWCFNNNIPAKPMLALMYKYWGAKETRAEIARGTNYTTGSTVFRVCISLTQPELEHQLTMWGKAP